MVINNKTKEFCYIKYLKKKKQKLKILFIQNLYQLTTYIYKNIADNLYKTIDLIFKNIHIIFFINLVIRVKLKKNFD